MTVQCHAELISVQIGLPRIIPAEKPWVTGFWKEPVGEPLWLGTTNLQGDGQADLVNHGGPHKAVCVYSADHFPTWRETLGLEDLRAGAFGENFTVSDLTEQDVCIGDVWSVGDAVVQVSQPRQPCWKLARRWGIKDLAYQVQQTGRTGWYFRVLEEGLVGPGMRLGLVDRSSDPWTIEAANRVMHHDKQNLDDASRLAAVAALSPSWQATLQKRIDKQVASDERLRLDGAGD
ncbi:6-N-hydroxylaminopurine resistance protein [Rosistilla carotiformis]|uniref:6-N-hydroxylaminopurine resistance protein n=1 Tax=Rosistilla carotiformis TaxID=2528017 RepID=A0A518JMK4_9BACT|nr:MOSC domain-containing protein [Rosistilla carotiformis]QDV66773.1 6-N-hydroxylaminopurine resistance protein [Rosistilla carotiformis]